MPNWKSYESSVRLLSAIIAAHPGLKLNYDDIGRFYGDGANYKSVWRRMTIINQNAKAIAAAVEAGQDPFRVPLGDGRQTSAISARFGGDCTQSAVENRFRRIKSDAKLINYAVNKGIDPITLNIGDTDGSVAKRVTDIAACYGSDTTAGAIRGACKRQVVPILKKIKACRAAGGDPKDLAIDQVWVGGKTDLAKYFGSDATPSSIKNAYGRQVRPAIKMLTDCYAAGGDAKDLCLEQILIGGKNEIQKRFGSHATKGGLSKHLSRDIKPKAALLQEALDRGDDPKDVILFENLRDGKSGTEIVRFYGSDCTKNGLVAHYRRDIQPNVNDLRSAVDQGEDPKTVVLYENVRTKGAGKEMASLMGSDVTSSGLRFQFGDRIRPIGMRLMEMRAAGKDAKDLDLDSLHSAKGRRYISKYFGRDSTAGGIQFQFRSIKAHAQLQKACYDSGNDPQTLVFSCGKSSSSGNKNTYIAFCLGDGTTAVAVEHRFRPIKKDALVMRAKLKMALRLKDTSAAALQHVFRSIKKDAAVMNAAIGDGGDGGSAKKTPQKRTPVKKTQKQIMVDDDGDDDNEEMMHTPSKKSALNKTKTGRVQKSTPKRGAAGKVINYAVDGSDSESEEKVVITKTEKIDDADDDLYGPPNYPVQAYSNAHGHYGYGNGNNGAGDEDTLQDASANDDENDPDEI